MIGYIIEFKNCLKEIVYFRRIWKRDTPSEDILIHTSIIKSAFGYTDYEKAINSMNNIKTQFDIIDGDIWVKNILGENKEYTKFTRFEIMDI